MPTVVIADDSATMRRIVGNVLTREGYEVVLAEDGLEAVQAVFRHQPDAVVVDVQMPRLSGYIVARLLKEDWSTADIPVVLLTSLDSASDRYWGDKTGAARYLTKDFEPPALAAAVAEVLATAAAERGGRDRVRMDPVELSDDDVLERTCDVLDRTLFQTSIAADVTEISATAHGFEQTVLALLGIVGRVVDHSLAGIVLAEQRAAYLTVADEVSQGHFQDFLDRAADALAAATGDPVAATDLEARVADPEGRLGADDENDLAAFLDMRLHGHGGRVLGLLVLSSVDGETFGEAALTTLKLLVGAAALVLDNALLAERGGVRAGLVTAG